MEIESLGEAKLCANGKGSCGENSVPHHHGKKLVSSLTGVTVPPNPVLRPVSLLSLRLMIDNFHHSLSGPADKRKSVQALHLSIFIFIFIHEFSPSQGSRHHVSQGGFSDVLENESP